MGREVKRVKAGFDWPVGTIWRGYETHITHRKRKHPPAGDWWQIWETTSEGSPITPAFATPEECARWAADNGASVFGASVFGYQTATYETWLKFLTGPGWAPSAVITGGQMKSGVEAVNDAG